MISDEVGKIDNEISRVKVHKNVLRITGFCLATIGIGNAFAISDKPIRAFW